MNSLLAFESPFSEVVVERVGWVLVQSLWQFALVALLARVTVGAMRRNSAAARYGVFVAAMAVSVAVPAVTWILQPEVPSDQSASRGASVMGRDSIATTSPADSAAGSVSDAISENDS